MTTAPHIYVDPDVGSHWYFYDGLPCYEVLRGDGTGYRVPTLRDAKKLNLVPSVTSIMKVLYKPQLERWKQEQLLLAALTTPKIEGEREYEYINRIIEDSRAEGMSAADFGTHIHSLIEWYCKASYLGDDTAEIDFLPDDKLYLHGWKEWAKKVEFRPELVEFSFANLELGCGGKIDCLGEIEGRRCWIDWKTQKTKSNIALGTETPITFYHEWRTQLSAYSRGMSWTDVKDICSVAISSTEPGRVEHKFWETPSPEIAIQEGWEEFEALKRIWYSPLQGSNTFELYQRNQEFWRSQREFR